MIKEVLELLNREGKKASKAKAEETRRRRLEKAIAGARRLFEFTATLDALIAPDPSFKEKLNELQASLKQGTVKEARKRKRVSRLEQIDKTHGAGAAVLIIEEIIKPAYEVPVDENGRPSINGVALHLEALIALYAEVDHIEIIPPSIEARMDWAFHLLCMNTLIATLTGNNIGSWRDRGAVISKARKAKAWKEWGRKLEQSFPSYRNHTKYKNKEGAFMPYKAARDFIRNEIPASEIPPDAQTVARELRKLLATSPQSNQ